MRKFFNLFFPHGPEKASSARLYGTIMTQARNTDFFGRFGLPDTAQSRFAVMVLHMFLVQNRLKAEDRAGQRLCRALTEYMVGDLDRGLREQGIGDVGVIKRMKILMQGYYQQMNAYEQAFSTEDEKALEKALDHHLFVGLPTEKTRCHKAGTYVRRQVTCLSGQPFADFLSGTAHFTGSLN